MLYTFGECVLDTQRHLLSRAGQPVPLRAKAFAILVYLMAHRDRVVPKQELCAQVWPGQFLSNATLGSTVRAVRQAIGDHGGAQPLLQTVHGYGYRWVAPVTVHTETPVAPVPAGAEERTPPALQPAPGAGEERPAGPTPPAVPTGPQPTTPVRVPQGERKVVTVLCGALVLPAAGQGPPDLDALHHLMQGFYQAVQHAVQQYGGTLQPPLGDRVLAVFGAPLAQEDHAVRAGLAALAVQQQFDTWQRTAGFPADLGLAVRLGLHTGLIAMGGVGEAPELVTALVGDVTATAVALQEQAAPGTICCSAATARLVQGRGPLTPVKCAPLLGWPLPEPVYLLRGGSPGALASSPPPGRVLSPFVGRERELTILHALLAQVEAGRGQVVGIVGTAGMGKSRLVAEFGYHLAARGLTVLTGRCLSYGSATPYLPVRELLRHHYGITDTNRPEQIRAHVSGSLQAWGMDPDVSAPVLLDLLGLPDEPGALATLSPEARKARIVTTLTQWCLQGSRSHPRILVFEDLRWSDPSTDEWLTTLVEQLLGTPLLVVGTYRPGYRPGWLDKSYVTQLALHPLSSQESLQVVQAVLPPTAHTAPLVPHLLAKADGNPFFLEELARTVSEQGLEATGASVPDTIQAVLLARLDRLPPTAKRLLQAAAVIGKDGAVSLLQTITDVPEETLQQDLARLQAAELLYVDPVASAPVYTFKHVLTQEVAYQSLLRRPRQHYHARIAQALAAPGPEMAAAPPELLAHHYTEADLIAPAIPYWQQAGERAAARSAHVEAIQHCTRGIALLTMLPPTPERTQHDLQLHLTLGASLTVTQGWGAPEVAHAYRRARELCQQLGDPPQLFPVLWGLWSFDLLRAAYQTAQTASAQLLTLAQRVQEAALLVEGHFALGTTGFIRGKLAPARDHLAQALARYDPQHHRTLATLYSFDPQVGSRAFGAALRWMLGSPAQAVQESQAALAWADEIGHPFSQAFARLWAAILHQLRREAPLTQAHADAAIALCTTQGAQLWRAGGTVFRGWAQVAQGQADGLAELRQGLTDWRRLGAEQAVTWYLGLLAESAGHVGQVEDGLRLVAEALALVAIAGEGFYTPELHRLQGELLLQQTLAQAPRAAACFQQALTVARHQQAKSWELRAATSLARLWQQQGKRREAYDLLAPIYGWFTEGFDTADLQEARALLEAWAG